MLSSLAVPAEAAAGRVSQEASAFSAEAAREAVDALVALGYSNLEASRAVKQVELTEDMDAEAVLKASLKFWRLCSRKMQGQAARISRCQEIRT